MIQCFAAVVGFFFVLLLLFCLCFVLFLIRRDRSACCMETGIDGFPDGCRWIRLGELRPVPGPGNGSEGRQMM